MTTRVLCPNGYDVYVPVKNANWDRAMRRMRLEIQRREDALSKWDAANKPEGYPDASYWAARNAFKATMPIEFPAPIGHVMFDEWHAEEPTRAEAPVSMAQLVGVR